MFIIFILLTVCSVDKLDPRSNYYPNRSIEILVNKLQRLAKLNKNETLEKI